MDPGDNVWNAWQGLLRYGTILSKRKADDGWTYFKVNWGEDKPYLDRIRHRKKLCGEDHKLEEYRADQIHPT